MSLFALKGCGGGRGSVPKHRIFLVSHDDNSVVASADLPFDLDDSVFGR